MAISYQTFKNVTGVTIGSTNMYGVQSINTEQVRAEIHGSGDADTHETIARAGTSATRITINTIDPAAAYAWEGLTGTVGATYTDAQATTNKTLAVVGCSVVGVNQVVNRDNPSGGTVSLIAESADGTTNPLSLS